jgi:hypothetical protein
MTRDFSRVIIIFTGVDIMLRNTKYLGRISQEMVIGVCEMYAAGISVWDIVYETHISPRTVKDIVRGITWVNISKNYDFGNRPKTKSISSNLKISKKEV